MANVQNMVGLEDHAMAIKERLAGSSRKLEIISIVGMAGLGKTTIARSLYDDPYIVHHFYGRSWITISQVYQKRDLLLGILSCQQIEEITTSTNIHNMSDNELSDKLYKCLKGKRYLIVMDDIWDIEAWNDMRRCFPNDNNGSRILFTTRLKELALRINPNTNPNSASAPPHELRFLSEDESWNLLLEKVFSSNGAHYYYYYNCPTELIEVGKQISKKCQGLPLSIVVVGGLLAKTEKTVKWWEQVCKSITSSYIINNNADQTQRMDILTLSYNHLPDHLKPCFLYFGAFPEDYEIHVSNLILLWMAEGFIEKRGHELPEDTAEGYLLDLIERSLILILTRRSTGGIKSCRIHDLLGDFCRKKAKEENFMEHIYRYDYEQVSSSSSSSSSNPVPVVVALGEGRRLCIHMNLIDYISSSNPSSSSRDACSFLHFAKTGTTELPDLELITSLIYEPFRCLRVFHLLKIQLEHFPPELSLLIHLRYLAVSIRSAESVHNIPSSISNLNSLESLIIRPLNGTFYLPSSIWDMTKLRHLDVLSNCHIFIDPIRKESSTQGVFRKLEDLQTFSTLVCMNSESIQLPEIMPNLRKLKCIPTDNCFVAFPPKLENLKLHCFAVNKYDIVLENLPLSLRKINLISCQGLPCSEISTLGRLPNLEVLHLHTINFDFPIWETKDGEFPQLKILSLSNVNIQQWNASREHFPSLQKLSLTFCSILNEIPLDLGFIPELELIEVRFGCSESTKDSARQILEDQQSMGNDKLIVIIM